MEGRGSCAQVLQHIFGFLDWKDLTSCALVSRDFYRSSLCNALWRDLWLRHPHKRALTDVEINLLTSEFGSFGHDGFLRNLLLQVLGKGSACFNGLFSPRTSENTSRTGGPHCGGCRGGASHTCHPHKLSFKMVSYGFRVCCWHITRRSTRRNNTHEPVAIVTLQIQHIALLDSQSLRVALAGREIVQHAHAPNRLLGRGSWFRAIGTKISRLW